MEVVNDLVNVSNIDKPELNDEDSNLNINSTSMKEWSKVLDDKNFSLDNS